MNEWKALPRKENGINKRQHQPNGGVSCVHVVRRLPFLKNHIRHGRNWNCTKFVLIFEILFRISLSFFSSFDQLCGKLGILFDIFCSFSMMNDDEKGESTKWLNAWEQWHFGEMENVQFCTGRNTSTRENGQTSCTGWLTGASVEKWKNIQLISWETLWLDCVILLQLVPFALIVSLECVLSDADSVGNAGRNPKMHVVCMCLCDIFTTIYNMYACTRR